MSILLRRRDFIAALGGAAALPLAARAQKSAVPMIGYLNAASEDETFTSAFREGLFEQGYAEGQNVEILYRWAANQYDRLPNLAAELVRRRVAVIFACGGEASALAAKSATATIPIVFRNGADPVELGLVASLNRPAGNLTGVYDLIRRLNGKRMDLLHKMVPASSSMALLLNPAGSQVEAERTEAETAARILGVQLEVLDASTPVEIETAFFHLAQRNSGALLVGADALFFYNRAQLAALAVSHGVPAIYYAREFAFAGGLMSYGARISDTYRLAGTYVGRILKGDKPADLPVVQPIKFELAINLQTARLLGIEVSPSLLAITDEVIE
jgi:putative ABC transport system substrate-binding protein